MELPHPLPDSKPLQVKSRILLSHKQKKLKRQIYIKGEILTD